VESANGPNEARLATGDDKFTLVLDQKGTKVTVHSDGTVLVEGRNGVTVDAGTGALTLKGKSVAISSTSGEITIDSGGALTAKAKTTAKLTGPQSTVEGTSTVTLTSNGLTTVAGKPVKIN
jgi:hypothetical protein